ncbi:MULTISPECIES: phenylalanine--tRNA ligase subunit beta [Rhodomicrobium]|uniref:phenylalanine--tRNA ligase subunit beta n=1 Tax=Rhodomicrobium TaxID=1068 RepID=UPI000B4ADE93|nr:MULTISPECIES: phenylalanine--tRNA ligase subunit beta [Rhodomicrobium]
MKFTLNWLKDHLDTKATLDEIHDGLIQAGLEVESIENPADKLKDFTVARVLEAARHPDADKLQVCKVDTGKGIVQVVCGAPNARAGLIGVFAAPGVYIPGSDFTLGKAKIRGVESVGMLCSERELQLSGEHNGIIELPESAAGHIGERYVDVMGIGDPVIDISVTPNRPDCLGVRGIARDLAALGLGKLKKEDEGFAGKGKFASPVTVALNFDAASIDACPVFAGRYIKGVKNGPSPDWLQQRLRAIGLRPINALVDVTNYLTFDRCRPLHVYDADKIQGGIQARLGRKGESFQALDGKTYEVDEAACVIADDKSVLGFGGIMGGTESGSGEETVNVFVESAYFDPIRTARTGRKHGIHSDARFRFERGIDPQSERLGINLATKLILDICGGEPSEMVVAGKEPDGKTVIAFDPARVEKLSGLKLKPAEITNTLKKLGFAVESGGNVLTVTAPSWRPDVHGGADLVEEVVRITGVDNVPVTPMPRAPGVSKPVMTEGQKRTARARRVLAGRGLVEAVTWSFVPRPDAELFGGGQPELELANPISSEMSVMRPSLLAGLVAAARQNANRGFDDIALFEVGQIYRGDKPEDQLMAAGGLRSGTAKPTGGGRHWDGAAKPVDLFDAKADALAVLSALGLDPAKLQIARGAPDWFHPGRSGVIRLGPKTVLGHFGELHPQALKRMDLDGPAAGFELFLEAIPASRRKSSAKPPLDLADLQPVRRDFAFVLASEVLAGDVVRAAQGADKALISGVSVFDVFEGASLGEGKKSLAIEVTLQPREKTLTDGEIEAVSARIVAEVKKATGGEIRG